MLYLRTLWTGISQDQPGTVQSNRFKKFLNKYRVAAIFPDCFQCFTMASKNNFLN